MQFRYHRITIRSHVKGQRTASAQTHILHGCRHSNAGMNDTVHALRIILRGVTVHTSLLYHQSTTLRHGISTAHTSYSRPTIRTRRHHSFIQPHREGCGYDGIYLPVVPARSRALITVLHPCCTWCGASATSNIPYIKRTAAAHVESSAFIRSLVRLRAFSPEPPRLLNQSFTAMR